MLAQLYVSQRRLEEAKLQYSEVLAKNPKSVPASTMIGVILEARNQKEQAESQYQKTLAIDPRSAVAANQLAWLYVSSNRNLDEALQLAQTARELLPDNPNVGDTLGWIFVKKNMAERAIPILEASAKKAPDDPEIHYHLGVAYVQSGDFTKAKGSLQRALSLRPNFEGADEARKALLIAGG
jgi:tetratricopeptide (TPR) repeat protein